MFGKKLLSFTFALALCLTMTTALADTTITVSSNDEMTAAITQIDAKNLGNVTIKLAAGTTLTGAFTVPQNSGTNVTVEGDGSSTTINGHLLIDGNSRSSGTEMLTIKNIVFDATGVSDYLVGQSGRSSSILYPHNVTIDGCKFSGSESTVCIKARPSLGYFTVKNCTAENMGSFFWGTGCTQLAFENNTVNTSAGILTGTSKKVAVTGNSFTTESYAVCFDLTPSYAVNVSVKDNTFACGNPFIVRADGGTQSHSMDVNGNTYSLLYETQADQVFSYAKSATADMITGEDVAMSGEANTFLTEPVPEPEPEPEPEVKPEPEPEPEKVPVTGDNSHLFGWMLMLSISAGALVLMGKRKAAER